jgi:hypothetical protein
VLADRRLGRAGDEDRADDDRQQGCDRRRAEVREVRQREEDRDREQRAERARGDADVSQTEARRDEQSEAMPIDGGF